MMESLIKDIRYGYRTLLRNPGFTAVAVVSLALGIGANTAIFSFVNTVLLKALPVNEPERLILFGQGKGRGNSNGPAYGPMELFSWREYQDFRKTNRVVSDLIAIDSSSNWKYAKFSGAFSGGGPEGLLTTLVSGNFFNALGTHPILGRVFDSSADTTPNASPFAVISYNYWERRFHKNPAVAGTTFSIGPREYTIIGVASPGFFGTRVGEAPDMWLPITMMPDFANADFIQLNDPQSHFLNLIGRLKPGVSIERASANINLIYQQILPGYVNAPNAANQLRLAKTATITINPAGLGLSGVRRRYAQSLRILMGVVALVLLIACANVANLLVALGAKREREIAVRLAIGAGRARLIRQLLTEGVMLSVAAGLLGVLLGAGAGRVLIHLISTGPRALPLGFELDGQVLAFTLAVSFLTGILFSLVPAIRASKVDLVTSLKEGKASMASPGKVTFGRTMVVGQVALSLTLLISAGLLVRSFRNLVNTGTGFDRENVLVFKIDSESSGYKQDQRLAALYSRIEDGLSHLPGVVSGGVSLRSFAEGHWTEGFTVPGVELPENQRQVVLNMVTPAFFATFHIPVLSGRSFDARDNAAAAPVAVIGETFARQSFGGSNPIGRVFAMSPLTPKDQQFRVIGIVRDVKTGDVRDKSEKLAYLPLAQATVFAGSIAVRVNGDPAKATAAVRGALHNIEPNLPIRWATTLADEVSDSLVRERAVAQLAAFFAALALLLSAIGLYGAISFAVARRTNEIGIRMALGANRAGVLGLVLTDAMSLVIAGIAIGIPFSIAAGKVMQSLLYETGAFDAWSAAAAVAVLALAAAAAASIPARRAAAVDPMVALRHE